MTTVQEIRACNRTDRHPSHVYYRGKAVSEPGSSAFTVLACPGLNPHPPVSRTIFGGPVYAWFGGPTWKAYVWHGKRARELKRDRKRSGEGPDAQERKHWELRSKMRTRLMDGGVL